MALGYIFIQVIKVQLHHVFSQGMPGPRGKTTAVPLTRLLEIIYTDTALILQRKPSAPPFQGDGKMYWLSADHTTELERENRDEHANSLFSRS